MAASLSLTGLGMVALARLPAPELDTSPRRNRAVHRTTGKRALVGTVTVVQTVARTRPGWGAPAKATFSRTDEIGTPRVFLLLDSKMRKGLRWYRALLPTRPNGSTGYLPATDLELSVTRYRMEIDRAAFELTLYRNNKEIATYPVGIGTGQTPTPVGRFYLISLLEPPDPDTIYGTYAYGLSGFSETLTYWENGGIVGLHGTNAPETVGVQASHGCIRMHNRDVEELVEILPLGTPVEIV